tara:strand:+ start:9705 stop:10241 length:537 start_codon:yes stop_codon:yes gene_type:complete
MRFAYADPPYFGCGKKFYKKHHDKANIWDSIDAHQHLIEQLSDYDGWSMSLSSSSLRQILPLCPEGVRVAAWVKPFAVFKKGVNPVYAWEPVIFYGVRKRGLEVQHCKDWVSANITMKKGLPGAKPQAFCDWILDMLGFESGDSIDDLFPGTGAMSEALTRRKGGDWSQAPLFQMESK